MFLLLGLLTAGTASASAAPRQVLIFQLTGAVPDDPGGALGRLTQVVARAAGLTEAEVAIGQVTFEDTAALAGCGSTDAVCLAEIARALRVDDVVLGDVGLGAAAGTVDVSLTAFVDGTITQRTFTLSATTVDAMVAQLAREVPALFVGPSEGAPTAPAAAPELPSHLAPGRPPAPPAAAEPPPAGEGGFRVERTSTSAWLIAGAGLALAGTGVAFLAIASGRQDEVDAARLETVADFERVSALEDEGRRFTAIGDGMLIGGAVGLAVGGALILYQGLSPGGEHAPPRVSLAPILRSAVAGVVLRVTLP